MIPPMRSSMFEGARYMQGSDAATVVQASLLPWGEGQDEGRFPRFKAPSNNNLAERLGELG
jgi:hypothetical protein